MLKKKYFDDSFILHDESFNEMHLKTFFSYIEKVKTNPEHAEKVYHSIKSLDSSRQEDPRNFLHKNWASFRNILKYQPMWDIRNYFGESNAIYFAWVGVFISVLWAPALIGFVFFIYGLNYA